MNEKIKKIGKEVLMKKELYYIIFFIISLILVISGIGNNNFNMALIGILILYVKDILSTMKNLKNDIYFLMFLGVIFVFILSRPIISMFQGNEWWYLGEENEKWSLISIYISLIGLQIGRIFGKKIIKSSNKDKKKNKIQEQIHKNINIISRCSLILFIISFVSEIIIQIDKLIFMQGRNYVEYYTSYVSNVPSIITSIANMMIIFLITYLMTKPTKKMTYFTLFLYILTKIPMLIIGERGSTITAIIFAFVYIWYRNSENQEKWINNRMKIAIVIIVPLAIIALGAYNYTRSEEALPSYNPFSIIVDFFYKQGVTFDVLNIGHGALDKLPNKQSKNYTFGGFIDYIRYNGITCKLLKTQALKSGNNIRRATESNSFAHAMSYTTRGQEYLDGHGWGSSYLLETYADYGYIGIIVYSVIIGIFLINIEKLIDRQDIFSIITLYCLTSIYLVPRAEALGFINFIIEIHFWMPIIIIAILTFIVSNKDKMIKWKEKNSENK